MKGTVVALSILAVAAVAGGAFMACRDDSPTAQPCRNIPAGGCPKSRGVACTDPACKAVYLCREDQTWELERTCPPRQELPDAEPPPTVQDASIPPRDSGLVVPPGAYGGPGCTNLQPPDCSLGTALGCTRGCCGCEDLFVCENGGWTTWGVCGDAGPVKSTR
jgi:hypothetical protein